jgi:hypothetical protein
MPTLTLIYDGKPLAFTLEKIDRDKLYGFVETQTLTTEGEVCSRATLCGDGHTLAVAGDVALAYLSPTGSGASAPSYAASMPATARPLCPSSPRSPCRCGTAKALLRRFLSRQRSWRALINT